MFVFYGTFSSASRHGIVCWALVTLVLGNKKGTPLSYDSFSFLLKSRGYPEVSFGFSLAIGLLILVACAFLCLVLRGFLQAFGRVPFLMGPRLSVVSRGPLCSSAPWVPLALPWFLFGPYVLLTSREGPFSNSTRCTF